MAGNSGIPVVGPILNKLIGSRNDRFVKRYTQRVEAIGAAEVEARKLTDAEIRLKFRALRDQHDAGASEEKLLVPTFAVAREAMDRAVGIRQVFNPERGFDASVLSGSMSDLYRKVRAEMMNRSPSAKLMSFGPMMKRTTTFMMNMTPIDTITRITGFARWAR